MSEAQQENPNQAAQPGAEQQAQSQQAQPSGDTAQTTSIPAGDGTFPIKLVKRETGDTHWNVAKGVYEKIVHAETGEPSAEYALLATIDGVDVTLMTFNAGGLETIVRSQKQLQQQNAG